MRQKVGVEGGRRRQVVRRRWCSGREGRCCPWLSSQCSVGRPLSLSGTDGVDFESYGRVLNLSEEEEQGVVVPMGIWHRETEIMGFFVVGGILSSKAFHTESLRTVLYYAFNREDFVDPGDKTPFGPWLWAPPPAGQRAARALQFWFLLGLHMLPPLLDQALDMVRKMFPQLDEGPPCLVSPLNRPPPPAAEQKAPNPKQTQPTTTLQKRKLCDTPPLAGRSIKEVGGVRPWRFEAHWVHEPDCEQVAKGWADHGQDLGAAGALGKLGVIIADLQQKERQLRDQLEALLSKREIYWRQRGKIHWLKEGDKNTSFFHAKAISRRKTNAITRLRDDNGNWVEEAVPLQGLIEHHFSKVFRSDQPSVTEMGRGTAHLTVPADEPKLLVSSLIDHDLVEWRRARLVELFHPTDVEAILSISTWRTDQADLMWRNGLGRCGRGWMGWFLLVSYDLLGDVEKHEWSVDGREASGSG
ncbi:hypothetical protein Salat_0375600 [Sesamum alatum]|uniref:Uncharacterized protein n=1 Tax=Sesamum alatum TaxID=300844 RepID=A0AAE1Z236_9LAMI|nr:hypothetical protein Salat_0375600 [Sesamum alatum]